MPNYPNLTEHGETYAPLRSAAEMFDAGNLGPSHLEGLDLGRVPDQHSSAARHVGRIRSRERAVQEQRDHTALARLAQEQREDEALEEAVRLTRLAARDPHRHKIGRGTRERAMAALARRDGTGLSTAEQLAANYMSRS